MFAKNVFKKTASVARFIVSLCLLQMQNLDVRETIQKIKITKLEIKKDSITNGKKNENIDMQEKVNMCTTNGGKVIHREMCSTELHSVFLKKNDLLTQF